MGRPTRGSSSEGADALRVDEVNSGNHSIGYGEMSRKSLSECLGLLVQGKKVARFLDIGSGAGRPTLHAACGFAHVFDKADGVEIGFSRFVLLFSFFFFVPRIFAA
jgi:hypothetical protein